MAGTNIWDVTQIYQQYVEHQHTHAAEQEWLAELTYETINVCLLSPEPFSAKFFLQDIQLHTRF
jgi:hypothetical protein